MTKDNGRTTIDLKSSLCTDNPTGSDVYPFSEAPTQVVQNTGMERAGGVTSIYEQETTFATAGLQSLVTKSGDLLQVDASHNIRINDNAIGNVGPYAVSLRGALKGYSDAAWTAGNTIIGIVKIGQTIKVDEINPATGAILNTRSTTFTMPSVAITNVVLVKYVAMNFADSLQFILSNNRISYILSESGSAVSFLGGQTWTIRTAPNLQAYDCICWSPQLRIFCALAQNGAVGVQVMISSDGINWTAHTSASAQQWTSVCWSPELGLFCAVANSGVVGVQVMTSPDGSVWTSQTSASARSWQSVCWSPQLGIFCAVAPDGAAGVQVMTSSNGTAWSSQTSASALNWQSVCWSPDLGLFCAVAQNSAAMISSNGTAWSLQTAASAQQWTSVCWSPSLGMFCAVALSGAVGVQIMTSTNGTLWTSRTSPSARQWVSICWSPELGIFCAVAQDGAVGVQVMISSDGINWASQASANGLSWKAVAWSPSLGMFSAVAFSAGNAQIVMTTSQISGTNFSWKFSASKYIVGNQGIGSFSIGDVAGTMVSITDATWCVIDQFAGTAFSRAILTFPVKKNASNLLTGIGEVGHNQAGTYSATPTYYGVALAAVTVTIGTHAEGPGYSEATFTRSDTVPNIYYYQAPIMQHNPGQWYDVSQSQTQTQTNGYGRLSDFNGNTLGNTCSLRVVMLNGIPSTISAGVIGQDATYDNLGVPITNSGEFDEFYMPHVTDNRTTRLNGIYRFNGILFFFTIQSGVANTLQKISDNLYMANCLSPVNAIDVANRSLNVGTNDYNGRILFRSTAAIMATAECAGLIQGPYANSVDPGGKMVTQTFSTTTNVVPGIELPSFIDRAVPSYGVNVYSGSSPAPVYLTTYQSFSVTYTNSNQVGVLYVPDTRLPVGMGYTFFDGHTMQTEIETIFMGVGVTGSADIDYDYLAYELGNDTPGQFQSFNLFGQSYLFDGNNIWLATFNGALFNGKGNNPVAPATGMQFIAASPIEAFFLSSFDTSLQSFNGGRSLNKVKRMNDLRNSANVVETIVNGVFNVRDNSLLLQTASSFVWVRDSVVTQNQKKANQTSVSLFETANGIQIANTTTKWVYSFAALSNSTVVPLTWQSAFHSLKANELSVATAWIVTLYSPGGRISAPVTLTCYSFDQENYSTNKGTITIQPSWWDGLGFCRLRAQPKTEKALASSLQIDTSSHLTITDVTVLYGDEAQATIAGARSI